MGIQEKTMLDTQLKVRISEHFKNQLAQKARAEGRTVSGFVRYVLARAVESNGKHPMVETDTENDNA